MEFLVDLWLPIVLSAVLVFIASSIFHMALPLHKGDKKGLPNEDKIMEAIRESGAAPDDYVFPYCTSMKDMGSPEMMEKYKKGPVGFLTLRPAGGHAMGPALMQWFGYLLIVSVFVAYIARMGLPNGAEYLKVFRVTGAIAVLIYAFGDFPSSIWQGIKWSTTFKFIFDGVVYGLLTAGVFASMWPS